MTVQQHTGRNTKTPRKKRLIIKVGSNVLTRNDGKLDVTRMSSIVDQVVWLKRNGYEVILISSGAVASGRNELRVNKKLDSVNTICISGRCSP